MSKYSNIIILTLENKNKLNRKRIIFLIKLLLTKQHEVFGDSNPHHQGNKHKYVANYHEAPYDKFSSMRDFNFYIISIAGVGVFESFSASSFFY